MRLLLAQASLGWLLFIQATFAAEPVLRVVQAERTGAALLANGGFEQARGAGLAAWQAAPKGFRLAAGEGRNHSQALACEGADGAGWSGASQTRAFNRTEIAPLVVRGWSKAVHVSGSPDSGYALYVDILYADGTPLWGQTANFRCGTHDWEQREFVILPEKPVKTLTLHCLLRGHSGQVWFDDVTVEEIKAEGGAMLFQGVPVLAGHEAPSVTAGLSRQAASSRQPDGKKTTRAIPSPATFTTHDGLGITLHDNAVSALQVDDRALAAASPSGFLARDVAANSHVYAFENGLCSALGLKVQANIAAQQDHIVVQGRLSDMTGRDRAVTLLFALPLDATGWHWGDDIRRSRAIHGNSEFANAVMVRCGATGTMSLYPLAALSDDRTGLALALDMAQPAQYRLAYHAGLKQFFIAYDFGLVPESERFPGSADFRFVLYRFDPRWGFRAAFQKLVTIFPGHFAVRSKEQGLWMPFTDIGTVQGWQDFGFKYHEGNNNVPFDDANGILSFRYTEPMTWWMPMKPEVPRTAAEALRLRDELAGGGNDSQRRMAQVSQLAGMFDESGQPCLLFRDEPWCNGAVWSLNPNPLLGAPAGQASESPGAAAIDQPPVNRQSRIAPPPDRPKPELQTLNAATVHWNAAIKEKLYGAGAKGELDGEYLDSLEGYVTAELNFRREHFRHTTVPLTFTSDTKQPALFKGLAVFEFTKWMGEEVHRLGKLTFANGVPYRFTFLCPWLDVLGTETDWLRAGQYQPSSDVQMSLWRTMAWQKPYLLLMNTDYDAFKTELVEKYFQRSLFYGMFPGMFSHNAADNPYWRNPKWYERDRPLFKKYLPLVKSVAEAGWQPVTEAACDNGKIFVERFGPDFAGAVYFALFNDTTERQSGVLRVDSGALQLREPVTARELVADKSPGQSGTGWRLDLLPQAVALIRLTTAAPVHH